MEESEVRPGWKRLFPKLYPWLLPTVLALLLVLVFTTGERVRRNTPEGRFNRIQMGMDRNTAYQILGPASFSTGIAGYWNLDPFKIEVYFDDEGKVWGKFMKDQAHREPVDL